MRFAQALAPILLLGAIGAISARAESASNLIVDSATPARLQFVAAGYVDRLPGSERNESSSPQGEMTVDQAVKIIEQSGSADAGDKSDGPPAPLSFVPPPRTIDDITAILDKQKPDPAKRAASLAAADKQPPANASPADMADFYYQRGLAASEVGRARQFLDDLKKVAALDEQGQASKSEWSHRTMVLSSAYQENGDLKGALDLQDQRLKTIEAKNLPDGMRVNVLWFKFLYALAMGRRDLAADTMHQLLELVARLGANRKASDMKRATWQQQALRAQARFALATGHYADAEADERRALHILETQLMSHEADEDLPRDWYTEARNGDLRFLSSILIRENRIAEAEAQVRIALLDDLQRHGRYAAQTAADILALASVLDEEARYAESEKLAVAARDTLVALGHGKGSPALAQTMVRLAISQSSQRKMAEARATYAELERLVGDNPEMRQAFLGHNANYAVVALMGSRTPDAIQLLQNVVAFDSQALGERDFATAQARGRLGIAFAVNGDKDQATKAFSAAMPILLSAARESETLNGDSIARNEQQTRSIGEAYLALMADTRGAAALGEMFTLADGLRGRMVEHALAASSARATASDPALANLARHEQDAQKEIAAREGMLANQLSLPSGEQEAGAVQKLREEIGRLQSARTRVRREIERKFPSYSDLVDPKPSTIEQAQASLRPGEAMITTFVANDRIFVWAIPFRGAPAFAVSKVPYQEVAQIVTNLRHAVDPNASTLDDIPAFDPALAYRLYELVLKPVEAGWAGAQTLIIVPHRILGELPLSLLVTAPVKLGPKRPVPFSNYKDVPFLVRKAAVAQLPSVGSLATLRSLPSPKGSRVSFAGFGDPWFNANQAKEARADAGSSGVQTRGVKTAQLQSRGIPLLRRSAPVTDGVGSADLAQLPRLPDTAEEVRNIALALHADVSKDVFLGAAANEKNVRTMNLSDRRIIVFATHGLVPGDLNGLTQPALALSSPQVAGGDGNGLLTVDKILGLKLDADWVVLSACNTAAGNGEGAEAISGLGRAFFYAGTRALLVSNWPVETTSARTLTTDLFRRQAEQPNLSRAEALRQAELALIDGNGYVAEGRTVFSYAHPIFWAPFSLVGDGGGSSL